MDTLQIKDVIKTLNKTEIVFQNNNGILRVGASNIGIDTIDNAGTPDERITITPQIGEEEYRVLFSSSTLNKQGAANATELVDFWEANDFFFDIKTLIRQKELWAETWSTMNSTTRSFLSSTGAVFVAFAGGALDSEIAGNFLKIPSDYKSGGVFRIIFTSNTTAGNIKWNLTISPKNDGDDYNVAGETISVVEAGVTQFNQKTSANIVPITSVFAADKTVVLKLNRDGGDAADTADNIASFMAMVIFEYTAKK